MSQINKFLREPIHFGTVLDIDLWGGGYGQRSLFRSRRRDCSQSARGCVRDYKRNSPERGRALGLDRLRYGRIARPRGRTLSVGTSVWGELDGSARDLHGTRGHRSPCCIEPISTGLAFALLDEVIRLIEGSPHKWRRGTVNLPLTFSARRFACA